MAILNRAQWLRIESRARTKGDNSAVNAQYRSGAQFRVPPAVPQNLAAEGGIGAVTFSWDHVLRTAAGKPLESLARYLVFYKYGTSSPIPDININDPNTYDGAIYVDNTQVSIPAGRQYVNPPGEWRDQIVAVRVVAIDRQHRTSKASVQVEGSPSLTRVPTVIDVGYIESYEPADPYGQQRTVVWDFPTFTVPDGCEMMATVWPLLGTYLIPGSDSADFFGWIEQHYYGLFFADELPPEGVAVLPAGAYTNLSLVIYHYFFGAGFFTCYEGESTLLPNYTFDFDNPGNMNLTGYLTEATTAEPLGLGAYGFQHVLWMVWQMVL